MFSGKPPGHGPNQEPPLPSAIFDAKAEATTMITNDLGHTLTFPPKMHPEGILTWLSSLGNRTGHSVNSKREDVTTLYPRRDAT